MRKKSPTSGTLTQRIARVALGTFLLFAGIAHLTFARKAFRAQVPQWVPVNTDLTVVLSGYVEIAFGLALIFAGRHQRAIGKIAAMFFLMVFPGNWAQYIHRRDAFGLDTDEKRLARLFFQPVLIAWALWSTNVMKNNLQIDK
ncbi:DoxX family protein [Olivibacter sitiensis]|uniref:DoxX family protein n=1 Tax=Olivibacter sitiensis TaxID=376470 RepID=UPI000566D78C|nr:membrane protein [Olivibacter sitiensis]